MEDRFLVIATWVFFLISITAFNFVALILSAVASVTIIIRNRFELISFYYEVKNKLFKHKKK